MRRIKRSKLYCSIFKTKIRVKITEAKMDGRRTRPRGPVRHEVGDEFCSQNN